MTRKNGIPMWMGKEKRLKEREPVKKEIHVNLEFSKILRIICVPVVLILYAPLNASALFQDPDRKQVEQALNRGKESARQHRLPNELYWHFGSTKQFEPHGFLVTKVSALAVMSGHFALRGEQPTAQDIQRILGENALQVVVTVYGNSPGFARDSYLLLKQGERVVKPARIRFDARALSVGQRQGPPVFRAKIVGVFSYGTFDLEASATLLAFPGTGGEIRFDLDFSTIL